MRSGAEFEFDAKRLERKLKIAARNDVMDASQKYQKLFDSLIRRYKGQPVEEIKPVLRREWKRIGGSISDPELTEYAQHISDGTRIRMNVKMRR